MSLNGLDDPKVKEAHEAAIAEPGGWFLLKYASRDEVELLGRGNGGIVEVRNSIAQYHEASPLYGFLRYRRRNVILKYLPDDCSRLVQARVTVHFGAVCDRFSPHDTTFSFSTSKELKDTKLSAACSLHTASGSTSSSTSSLRRRRLMEITEEEEEEQREKKRQSTVDEEDRPRSPPSADIASADLSSTPTPPVTLNPDLAGSLETSSGFTSTSRPPHFFAGAPRPSSPAKSFDDAARRKAVNSGRPDLYSYSTYTYGKPKVKLGPRPSVDAGGRPGTASSAENFRPVASVPTGLRPFKSVRKAKTKERADSTSSAEKEEAEHEPDIAFLATSVPIPENGPLDSGVELTRPHTSGGREASVVRSRATNLPALPTVAPKRDTITPEKARLMKAMKLREKKKKMVLLPTDVAPGAETVASASETDSPALPLQGDDRQSPAVEPDELVVKVDGEAEGRLSMSNPDSGVAIDAPNDHISVDTRSDSHPASPIISSSDVGDSTKASSLSESTDETIQPGQEEKLDELDERVESLEMVGDEAASTESAPTVEGDKGDQIRAGAPANEMNNSASQGGADHDEQKQKKEEGGDEEPGVVGEEAETTALDKRAPAQKPNPPLSEYSSIDPVRTPDADEVGSAQLNAGTDAGERAGLQKGGAAHATNGGGTSGSPQFAVPLSKFSRQQGWPATSAATSSMGPPPPIPSIVTPLPDAETAVGSTRDSSSSSSSSKSANEAATAVAADISTSEAETASIETRRSRRQALVERIRTDLDAPGKERAQSDANLSDDDDLMDELQSATLQEAQPINLSKSPITPVLPSPRPDGEIEDGAAAVPADATDAAISATPTTAAAAPAAASTNNHTSAFGPPGRAVSNPIRPPLLTPTGPPSQPARSVSSGAAFGHKGPQQASSSDLRPKAATKIGSSISQRIKALEKLSGSNAAAPDAAPKEQRPSSSFFSVRKASSVRDPSRSSPSVDAAPRGGPTSPTLPGSRESSPATTTGRTRHARTGSMASRLSMFEGGSAPRGRPESIQVTARIVRDPSQPFPKVPEPKAPADYGPLDLKQSPLVVDHQRASPGASPSATPAPATTPPAATEHDQPTNREEKRLSLLQRRLSRDTKSQAQDRTADDVMNGDNDLEDAHDAEPASHPRRRSSLTVVKDFIKDRRGSILGGKSPSADNLNLDASPLSGGGGLASPASVAPMRSPSSRPPSVHHNSVFPRRLSISSRRSSIDQKSSSPGQSTGGLAASPFSPSDAGAELDGENGKSSRPGSSAASITSRDGSKSSSRATRFMRRLSNSFSSRKNATPSISPTVAEEDDADVAAQNGGRASDNAAYAPPSIVAFMGDVNVQFPDNLLWKRRSMCLDSHGFLILSAVQGMSAVPATATGTGRDFKQQAGAIKRYHLSDFRPPYTPEMEMQELPNSIVLDFIEGSGLQIACEDRPGQLNVLHILEDAYKTHTG